jgi:ligand-binding sensor domain-containing protein/signal transduction histidine kinase
MHINVLLFVRFQFLRIVFVVVLVVVLGFTGTENSGAQTPQTPKPRLAFEHISIEQGMSQSSAFAIVQDRQGFLWFATQNGLNRYDGYSFRNFPADPNNPKALANSWIRSLCLDAEATLWVGTTSGGIARFDSYTESFTTFLHKRGDSTSLSDNLVYAICKDSRGVLWVGTERGLNRYDAKRGAFTRFYHNPRDTNSLAGDRIRSIIEDSSGRLWIGTMDGLSCLDAERKQFVTYSTATTPGMKSNTVLCVCEDAKRNIWFGTQDTGLHLLNPITHTCRNFEANPNNPIALSNNQISALAFINGMLWVGTAGGGLNILNLTTFNGKNAAFAVYQQNSYDPKSLSDMTVRSFCKDRQGIVWIGTRIGGVNKLDYSTMNRFHLYQHDVLNPASLNSNSVYTICEALDDGENIARSPPRSRSRSLWVGTLAGGISRLDPASGKCTPYTHDPKNTRSISSNAIEHITQTSDGRLLISTWGDGLCTFDQTTRAFTPFTILNSVRFRRSEKFRVRHVWESKRHNELWIATYEGVARINQRTQTAVFYQPSEQPGSVSSYEVLYIYEDRSGEIWLGTVAKGFNRYNRATDNFTRFQNDTTSTTTALSKSIALSINNILMMGEDSKGNFWICTEIGINLFDRTTGRCRAFTQKDGLPNDYCYGFLEDAWGRLWISTNKGLSCFDPAANTFRNYDVSDGLPSNEFNHNAYCKTADGRMYFGTVNGLVGFHPDSLQQNTFIPPIALTGFSVFNKPADGLPVSISEARELTVRYDQNVLTFQFTALNFSHPEKNQYKYRLEGFDKAWIEAGSRREATYTNLDPGEYTFRVVGSNNDGVWNEQERAVRLIITPPWWRTWWAFSAYGIAFIGLAFVSVFTLQREQRRELLQEQERRETALLINKNVELSTANTEISRQTQMVQEANTELNEKNITLIETLDNLRRTQKQLVQAEKMASLGTLVAGVAHELNTPIGVAVTAASTLQERTRTFVKSFTSGGLKKSELDAFIKNAQIGADLTLRNLERAADLVQSFKKVAVDQTSDERRRFKLGAYLREISTSLQPMLKATQHRIEISFAEDVELDSYPGAFSQIITNFVQNSVKHGFDGFADAGVMCVEVRRSGQSVVLEYSDNGRGIPSEVLPRIFDPFFTTKPGEQGGTGLGLHVVYNLATQKLGGELRCESGGGVVGTRFIITLPT